MEIDVAEIPLRAGFTSKELDPETSLYYFGARYYDPWRGQLNSIDPHSDLYAWSSPYSYAGDNPVSFLDRTGMDSTNSQRENSIDQLPPQGPVALVGAEEIPVAPPSLGVVPTKPVLAFRSLFEGSLPECPDPLRQLHGTGFSSRVCRPNCPEFHYSIIPFLMIDLSSIEIPAEVLQLIPKEVATNFHVIPLSSDGETVHVALPAGHDQQTVEDIQCAVIPYCTTTLR